MPTFPRMGAERETQLPTRVPPDHAAAASRTPVLRFAATVAALGARYHRAGIQGLENLPAGPALIVANHGLYGLDTPVFFHLLQSATGRMPVGLAERLMCKLPSMRRILEEIGGVEGTQGAALRLLRQGRLVVCYPGGAREVFKEHRARHRLQWGGALGFVQVARKAQVPIVPVAGLGIDDTYRILTRLRPLARLVGDEKYAVPISMGLGAVPLPARFHFRIGAPVGPPAPDASESALLQVKKQVQSWIEWQLAGRADPGDAELNGCGDEGMRG